MLLPLLILARQAGPFRETRIASLTVGTWQAGACSGGDLLHEAAYRIAWELEEPDLGQYTLRLYEDDAFKDEFDVLTEHYTIPVSGYVEGGPVEPILVDKEYRLDVVRTFDNAVVSTASVRWTKQYGKCGSPGGGDPGGGSGGDPGEEPE